MRLRMRRAAWPLVAILVWGAVPVRGQDPGQRAIAITVDDLPAAAAGFMTGAEIKELTAKLLGTLKEQKVPAVGFVNEKKLYKLGEVDDRIAALKMWAITDLSWGITRLRTPR